ncbi:PhoX family phosphatase [Catenovulum sp. SM1970]|uniref:PhoX family protein n=1 Tax=Marinifaba aquimaris TaxID=2741323 RepID=UPI0015735080|nr:PhoX family phosphatase [Marinifaba aquimaris]NTS77623.1 PhoX family phosphatase [Marinifaba aquimaris]
MKFDTQKVLSSEAFPTILERNLSRRGFLKSTSMLASSSILAGCMSNAQSIGKNSGALNFKEVKQGLDANLTLAENYNSQVLLRWGDALFPHSPNFDFSNQNQTSQELQFGYNNDFVGFIPLPLGSNRSDHGLLVVNHEATDPHLMFKGIKNAKGLNKTQTDIDIAAHGLSVVEIKRQMNEQGFYWQLILDSSFNRRITPWTDMAVSGPAAGHQRMQSKLNPSGRTSKGTYGNCAGGVTPWGTVLTAEENVDGFFTGDLTETNEQESLKRFGFSKDKKSWGQYYARWDLNKDTAEAFHAGWIVEVDPFDPNSKPVKHSALGRFKHEACNLHIAQDGTVIAYMGDDQAFEYIYKFVSKHKYKPGNDAQTRAHNKQLLSEGTLFVAQFKDNNQLTWLPLIYGEGPLTKANGFSSQADISIDTRKAADLLNATPMDRPEDVEVNPVTGKVYVMLTKNKARKPHQTDGVNPRSNNKAGQVIEIIADDADHKLDTAKWELMLLTGDPTSMVTFYHPATTQDGWLACPDNCAFDNTGNLWIGTDGCEAFDIANGLWACATEGEDRGLTKRFLRTPKGAELCGPFFTPDNKSLFCAIQHPGEDGSLENPDTRWPDFSPDLPPRPAVVAISHRSHKVVGS